MGKKVAELLFNFGTYLLYDLALKISEFGVEIWLMAKGSHLIKKTELKLCQIKS